MSGMHVLHKWAYLESKALKNTVLYVHSQFVLCYVWSLQPPEEKSRFEYLYFESCIVKLALLIWEFSLHLFDLFFLNAALNINTNGFFDDEKHT